MALWYRGKNHTADTVMVADSPTGMKVALIKRKGEPFKGYYAFPGGFVDTDAPQGETFVLGKETPKEAAIRELYEEVSVALDSTELLYLAEIGLYDDINRDPRNTEEAQVVSSAFLARLAEAPELTAADDAVSAQWLPLKAVASGRIPLAFDHDKILKDAINLMKTLEAN